MNKRDQANEGSNPLHSARTIRLSHRQVATGHVLAIFRPFESITTISHKVVKTAFLVTLQRQFLCCEVTSGGRQYDNHTFIPGEERE